MLDFDALNQLARQYEDAGDEEMAYRCYLENAMTEADGESLMQLGKRYLFGEYVNEDYDKAGHYFEMAYEAGQKLPGSAFIIIGSCKAKQKERPESVMHGIAWR